MATVVLFELSLKVAMIDKLINRTKHLQDGHDDAIALFAEQHF